MAACLCLLWSDSHARAQLFDQGTIAVLSAAAAADAPAVVSNLYDAMRSLAGTRSYLCRFDAKALLVIVFIVFFKLWISYLCSRFLFAAPEPRFVSALLLCLSAEDVCHSACAADTSRAALRFLSVLCQGIGLFFSACYQHC